MSIARVLQPFRRRDVRVDQALDAIEGLWQSPGHEEMQPIRITDISPDGFGMKLDFEIAPGTDVTAIFSQPFVLTVSARVVWCQESPDGDGYRVGLSCDRDGNRRLDSIYRRICRPTSARLF
jgi:hypothetical protein